MAFRAAMGFPVMRTPNSLLRRGSGASRSSAPQCLLSLESTPTGSGFSAKFWTKSSSATRTCGDWPIFVRRPRTHVVGIRFLDVQYRSESVRKCFSARFFPLSSREGSRPPAPKKRRFSGARRAGTVRSPPSAVAPLRVAGFRFPDSSSPIGALGSKTVTFSVD